MLNSKQVSSFQEKGYVLIDDAVDQQEILNINSQIDKWVHQSRQYDANYGALIDGQPRFDLEPGHCKSSPKLRRVTNPQEVSEAIKHTLLKDSIAKYMVPILGPDIKFDHSKINAKHPGMKSDIKYHQDHIFEPQTNDSVIVALLMLNDSTEENGCLKVVPGSHEYRYPHTRDGKFTGTIDDAYTEHFNSNADLIEAKAGSLCLMHTWAVHGSEPNRSSDPRRLLITEYKAADAFPLTPHKLPSRFMDAVVLGCEARAARHREVLDFELPDFYEGDSLFDLQETAAAETGQSDLGFAVGAV